MPERYIDAIIKFLAEKSYRPVKPRQLAREMGVSDKQYDTFREAVKRLRDRGRIVLGERSAVMLPQMGKRVVGTFQANPRGFGFVVPENPNAHGDLYVPEGAGGGAMTGDRVVARVQKRGRRGGELRYAGVIVEILERATNRVVGELQQTGDTAFVVPEGSRSAPTVVVRDLPPGAKPGQKVVVEITEYAESGDLPKGVIVETLGESGPTIVETLAVIRAHGLSDEFPPEALDEARAAAGGFDAAGADGRDDLTGETIVTIDPPDARDFDDAISLYDNGDGTVTLGVHIADVSHFVPEGGELDAEARQRGTSVYFPRRVVPMLPEMLSNGVCSLQEGERRFCKSAFITYGAGARPSKSRVAETVIRSAKRLTYEQAQGICDGRTGGYDARVVELVQAMEKLARRIEARRRDDGMLHLDLPEVELVFDEQDRVVDAAPGDDAYTHTIIEMFMVEANEAVARLFERLNRPVLRRIHPEPDPAGGGQLTSFVRAAGHKIPRDLTRKDLQALLAAVRGKPESYAVNLAVLRTFQQAEYSPRQIGHFALASDAYCHFTSPIRRYADLTVHRMVAEHCRGRLDTRAPEDISELTKLGERMTAAERRAEAAEDELREVLILQLLETKIGEEFDGVITGVANFGLFVQSRRFLIEGLVRMADLGDDWWEVEPKTGQVRGERSGRKYRIGDVLKVRIVNVDLARRQLDLALGGDAAKDAARPRKQKKGGKGGKSGKKPKGKKRREG